MYPPPQPSQLSSSYSHSQRLYQPHTPTTPLPQHPLQPRTPAMDPSLFAVGPPSPTSPFNPSTPGTSLYHTRVPSNQSSSRPYMSPSLAAQIDSLAAASPALLQSGILPSSDDQHVTVHEFAPQEGAQGTQLTIKCDVKIPPTPPPSRHGPASPEETLHSHGRALRVVFGTHPVQTQVLVLNNQRLMGAGQMCQLNAIVPTWSSTGAGSIGRANRIPIYVQVLDGSHAIVETVPLGEFTYTNTGPKGYTYTNYTPTSVNPLKRGGESLESNRPSPNQFLHRRVLSNGPKIESPEMSQYSQMPPAYHTSPNPGDTLAYSSPYISSAAILHPQPNVNYSPSSQPSFMRATQVMPPSFPPPVNSFNTSSSIKATLELTGDLDTMSKGWTQDEWMNRRRLVQFWRRQDGTTIYAAFRPLAQQDYPQAQQSIIISCIFREDKNECYVTSVDAIYLLEALVGTRFTVEEKNRIRRNLEGFRPITVSKSKTGSEDFFKLIMGFPNPKPRNIEKDVKVFPWDIIGQALKKIIGKYSASYAPPNNGMQPPHSTFHMANMQCPPSSTAIPGQDQYPVSAGSVPTLLSHSPSDSSTYGENLSIFPPNIPQTPLMHIQHRLDDSPTHYRSMSGPQRSTPSEKIQRGDGGGGSGGNSHGYVNYSPTHTSPYTAGHGHGSGGYWSGGEAVSSESYRSLQGPGMGGYGDQQPHRLPHVHQTHSRQPSSNDLRVVYPALAQ